VASRKKEESTVLKTRHYECGRPGAGGSLLQAKISCRTLPRDVLPQARAVILRLEAGELPASEVVEVEQGVEDEEINCPWFRRRHMGIVGE